MAMRKFLVMLLVGGLLLGGAVFGTGEAHASIEPGRYQAQYFGWGVVPNPPAHARIIGTRYYEDYYGVGPRNTQVLQLKSTKRGMIGSYARNDVSRAMYHVEFRKTRYGYKGVAYYGGIPGGDLVLRKIRR